MVEQKQGRRYYKVDEVVFIKELKKKGKIIELDVKPEEQIYKATIQYNNGKRDVTEIFALWEIDKLKNKALDFKHSRANKREVKQDTILFAKVRKTAVIPSKENEDAGYDIYADFTEESVTILPHTVKMIPTGIAVSVIDKYWVEVKERGSTGSKNMARRCGVVDSGYRDEIFVAIANNNEIPLIIAKNPSEYEKHFEAVVYPYNKAIAQLVVHEVPKMNVKEISYEELKAIPSKRGVGRLGSSNK